MSFTDDQMTMEGVPDTARDTKKPAYMIARINAMALKIVFPFVAQDDIRYYLNGINIRPLDDGAVMIVATDGHRYVVVHDQSGYAEKEIIVSVKKDGLKTCNSKCTFDVMSNGSAIINDEVGIEQFIQPGNSLIEGTFPRIENIASCLGYREGISGSINPSYLEDALAIGKHFSGIRFFSRDADSPLAFVVDSVGDLEVFGGIMKRRDSYEQLPRWFPRPSPFELTES